MGAHSLRDRITLVFVVAVMGSLPTVLVTFPWWSLRREPFTNLALGLLWTAALTALVSLSAVPVLAAVGWLGARLRRPWVLPLALGALSLVLAGLAIELYFDDLGDRDIKLDARELYAKFHLLLEAPLYCLGFSLLVWAAAAPSLRRALGRVRARRALWALVALAAMPIVAVPAYSHILPRMPNLLLEGGHLPRFANLVLTRLADFDGDGAPRWAGIDCDDDNPRVSPTRAEIPGNGIDDNCMLGDLPKRKARAYPRAPLDPPLRRVFLFAVDTLRADHLPFYGYERDTAPFLSKLAERSAVFSHASSSGGITPRVFGTLWSGRYDSGRGKSGYGVLRALGNAGVHRAAVVMHRYALKANQRGWDETKCPYCTVRAGRYRRKTGPLALEWAKDVATRLGHDEQALVMVHLFDPHAKYVPHDEVPTWGVSEVDRYDGEIRYTDLYIERILQVFEDAGLLEDAAIVLFGDHGEAFNEHGLIRHGESVFDEMNRVPLLIHVPGMQAAEIGQPVENGDLAPTLLDLFGVPAPRLPLTGASLLPLLEGRELAREEALGFSLYKERSGFALTRWPHKLIWHRHSNVWMLFDLERDPGETVDLSRSEPALLKELRGLLQTRVEANAL